MRTLTKEWLQLRIAELEEERDATPGAVNEDAALALAAMKLALASLEAEPVMYAMVGEDFDSDATSVSKAVVDSWVEEWNQVGGQIFRTVPLYSTPPAPVSVPDDNVITQHFDTIALETAREIMCDVSRRHEFLGGEVQLLSRIQCRIDEACRAAMLQGADGNSPVIPDGWVLVPKEPTPDMLNAAWVSHGIYHASAYRTMLAAAPQQVK